MALDLTKVALAGAWSPPFGPRRAGRASTLSLQAGPWPGEPAFLKPIGCIDDQRGACHRARIIAPQPCIR